MITLNNISISRGAEPLLTQVSFALYAKQIMTLVGKNGCGKSSLFAAILGELEPSDGEISLKSGTRINHLQQEVQGTKQTALDYVVAADEPLAQVLAALAQAEALNDFNEMAECHHRLSEMDGYAAQANAAKILHGLGFSQATIAKQVKSFSGGWRMRLNLARCLFKPSDLLLLDEPTNHLDMEAIIWLEKYLKHYSGAVLMVSHDRDFIDRVTTDIAHIEAGQVKLYHSDYSNFELLRAQQIALQNAQFRKQQAQINHMMKYVDRFRFKASKAKQAQSRLKRIERMELLKPIHDTLPFRFEFQAAEHMPNPMVKMDRVDLGYGDDLVLCGVKFSLAAGMRIGLLGLNGAGKSTFIKGLCGALTPLSGQVDCAGQVKIGYFAQHQVDELSAEDTPLQLLRRQAPHAPDQDLIRYLGSFGFDRDAAQTALSQFSGGEKSRVALAMIIQQRPNLLLLDEPTNHLDLETREALMLALQQYNGALILVSHDRYLLRSLVDELYLITDGTLSRFSGTVEDYQKTAA